MFDIIICMFNVLHAMYFYLRNFFSSEESREDNCSTIEFESTQVLIEFEEAACIEENIDNLYSIYQM